MGGPLSVTVNGAEILGGPLRVHDIDKCAGERCCIHNPGIHHMVSWPLLLRGSGLMERLCSHHIGHPDPDSMRWLIRETGETHWGVHGCDGCCSPPDRVERSQMVPA